MMVFLFQLGDLLGFFFIFYRDPYTNFTQPGGKKGLKAPFFNANSFLCLYGLCSFSLNSVTMKRALLRY